MLSLLKHTGFKRVKVYYNVFESSSDVGLLESIRHSFRVPKNHLDKVNSGEFTVWISRLVVDLFSLLIDLKITN